MTSTSHEAKYLSYIDALRGISVIAVILFHLRESWLPGGFAGVDVFFVISGYVVTYSQLSKKVKLSFKDVAQFYINRFFRLYPAMIVMVLISCLGTILFTVEGWTTANIALVAKRSILGIANFSLAGKEDGYWGTRAEFNPYTHTWSLGVEEQFYFIFPFIFILLCRFDKPFKKIAVIATVITLSLLSLNFLSDLERFYLPFGRAWELMLGVFIAVIHANFNFSKKNIHNSIFYILYGILFYLLYTAESTEFPFPGALLVCFVVALFIHLSFISLKNDNHISRNPFLMTIGKISYSLYLWHWPVIVLFKWTIGLEELSNILISCIIFVSLSLFSYKYIESIFRHFHNTYLPNNLFKQLGVVLFLVLTTSITLGYLFKNQSRFSLSVVSTDIKWKNDQADFSLETKYPDICNEVYVEKKDHVNILRGSKCQNNRENAIQIFAFGDSHLGRYSSLLKTLVKDFNFTVYQFNLPGCSFLNFRFPINNRELCANHISKIISTINKHSKSGDIIFSSSLKMPRFTDQNKVHITNFPEMLDLKSDEIREANDEFYSFYNQTNKPGLHYILEAPKLIIPSTPYLCQDWFNKNNPVCRLGFEISKDYFLKLRQPILDNMKNTLRPYSNTLVFDSLSRVCPRAVCGIYHEEKLLFIDGDHVTRDYNQFIYDDFVSAITAISSEFNMFTKGLAFQSE